MIVDIDMDKERGSIEAILQAHRKAVVSYTEADAMLGRQRGKGNDHFVVEVQTAAEAYLREIEALEMAATTYVRLGILKDNWMSSQNEETGVGGVNRFEYIA